MSATPSEDVFVSHTPGPWKTCDPGKQENPLMIYCDDSLGSRVADLSKSGHGIPMEVDHANARLICAAPDLLAALKGLFEGGFISAGTREQSEWAQELLVRIVPCREAIAKAEGRHG